MQTMRDQTACALQKLSIFIAERVQLITLHIQHAENVPVLIPHRDDDLRARGMKCRQIARIVVDVADYYRLARIQRRAAKPLRNRKSRVGWRLVAGFRLNHELVFNDFVNGDPPITARGADHLYELRHSFSGAPPGQRKPPDLLQLLASGFFHARERNVAQNKPSASTISTFCDQRLLDDDVGKTGIRADGWRIEQRAIVDLVRIAPKNLAARYA